jgi:hypothetical protein
MNTVESKSHPSAMSLFIKLPPPAPVSPSPIFSEPVLPIVADIQGQNQKSPSGKWEYYDESRLKYLEPET